MYLSNIDKVKLEDVVMEGASKVKIQWLINEQTGAPNFAMRLFTVGEGGHTPLHKHDFEHEILVFSGKGILVDGTGKEQTIERGNFAYVPPNETHQFRNAGKEELKFICLVPIKK